MWRSVWIALLESWQNWPIFFEAATHNIRSMELGGSQIPCVRVLFDLTLHRTSSPRSPSSIVVSPYGFSQPVGLYLQFIPTQILRFVWASRITEGRVSADDSTSSLGTVHGDGPFAVDSWLSLHFEYTCPWPARGGI